LEVEKRWTILIADAVTVSRIGGSYVETRNDVSIDNCYFSRDCLCDSLSRTLLSGPSHNQVLSADVKLKFSLSQSTDGNFPPRPHLWSC